MREDFLIRQQATLKETFNKMPALQFAIRDYGKGIQRGESELIFDKFTQGSDTTVGTSKGTGLGLSICNEIIKAHSGKIWAENHPDSGAIFKFAIPVDQV